MTPDFPFLSYCSANRFVDNLSVLPMNRVTESTLLVHLFCLALLVLLRSIIIPMFYGRYMETIFRRLPVAGSTSTDHALRGLTCVFYRRIVFATFMKSPFDRFCSSLTFYIVLVLTVSLYCPIIGGTV